MTWRFLEADDDERAAFADWEATLQRAAQDACAPPNTHRSVHRAVLGDGRVYYVKRFERTLWKNRLRNLRSQPRCQHDAEREARVAAALRAAGHAAARPVAYGVRGTASLYVCAELAGVPFAQLIEQRTAEPELADRIARASGSLLRGGFLLPDLSADHVYVDPDAPLDHPLGLLDLHDGAVSGTLDRRTLKRVLRRFQRSVRALPVARRAALRFAVRLCHAADRRAWTRATIESLPPFDTHSRYDRPGKSTTYRARAPRRDRVERDLLLEVWPGRPGETVLDLPCGAGRLGELLTGERGAVWTGADRSIEMLGQSRDALGDATRLVHADATAMPFADGAFDGVVCFRFLHHLPDAAARKVVAEAARIARRFVVVSWFHPASTHHLSRVLRSKLGGRAAGRFARTTARLDRWLGEHGLRRTALNSQGPLRDLRVGAWVRG